MDTNFLKKCMERDRATENGYVRAARSGAPLSDRERAGTSLGQHRANKISILATPEQKPA
jgi:hypothetical protein